ncbi:MAG: peptidoglycan-binding protein [Syntrophaceae bacterium]|nr:peptidoglycan-binding protein [Syntrophaceae bacterium]
MESEFLTVLGLATLPALGNFSGGVLAEWLRPSKKTLNHALHAATGIILAVVAVEVMPAALAGAPAWLLALAFMGGGSAYLFIESGVKRWQEGKQAGAGAGAWMVYLAVATDLVGDGLFIGTGSAVSSQMALILALGQVLADIPEGFATIANFRDKGVGRAKRLLVSASFLLPVVIAAILAYVMLQGRSEIIKMAGLVFVAGLYMLAAMEDMMREAHESAEDSRWSALSLLAGFAIFLVISGWL